MPRCPSCESPKVEKFLFWFERNEWTFVCRETNTNIGHCRNIWIESEATTWCIHCNLPLNIELRRDQLGYWCPTCDRFPTETKKPVKLEQ